MAKRLRIVLQQEVRGLGKKGDVLTVAPGYAKNALFPSGAAVPADASSLQAIARASAHKAKQEGERMQREAALRERLQRVHLHLTAPANAQGVLYGGIAAARLAAAFTQQGVPVDAKHIRIAEALRTVGLHRVTLLFSGWTVDVPVTIEAAPPARSS